VRFRAVLLDWRGTLVHYLDSRAIVRRALEALGRPADAEAVEQIVKALSDAYLLPEFVEAELSIDTSAELHRKVSLRMFEVAGLDGELSEALYPADFAAANHPLYPDVPQALERLQARDIKVAVVSDIHFDLRPEMAERGLDGLIDAYVLSFEHGFQKPDSRMFERALELLAAEPAEAIMVGDSAAHDGGAAAVGITTLILPVLDRLQPRGLDLVLKLVEYLP
jgi:HAD superfamily hydrolase (TIGR01509 family)